MLGCIIAIFAFFLPRVAILILGVFTTFITKPFASWSAPFNGLLLPIIGFIFLPYTLLAYCLAIHQHGSVSGLWTVLVVVAVLFDLGVIGGGAKTRQKVIVKKVKAD
jgi:hypothetical protein